MRGLFSKSVLWLLLPWLSACELRQTQTAPWPRVPEGISAELSAEVKPDIANVQSASDLNRYFVHFERDDASAALPLAIYRATVADNESLGNFEDSQFHFLRTLKADQTRFDDREVVPGGRYQYRFFAGSQENKSPLLQSLALEVPEDRVIDGKVRVESLLKTGEYSLRAGRILFLPGAELSVLHYGLYLYAEEIIFQENAKISVHGVQVGELPSNDTMTIAIQAGRLVGHLVLKPHNSAVDSLLSANRPAEVGDLRAYQSPELVVSAEDATGFSYELEKAPAAEPTLERWRRFLSGTLRFDLPGDSHFVLYNGEKAPVDRLAGVYQGPRLGEKRKALYFSPESHSASEMTVLEDGKFSVHWTSRPRLGGATLKGEGLTLLERADLTSWDLKEETYQPVSAVADGVPSLLRFDELSRNLEMLKKKVPETTVQFQYSMQPNTIVTARVELPNDVGAHQLEFTRKILESPEELTEICESQGIKQIVLMLFSPPYLVSEGAYVHIPNASRLNGEQIWTQLRNGKRDF